MNTFVLDTSVLVSDPYAINSFNDSEVILPITVLEELDKLKKFPAEVGKNARLAIKQLDAISNSGDIILGVELNNNIQCKIDASNYGVIGNDASYGDSRILGCATTLKTTGKNVILVSKDINLRVRAKALGIMAQDYENNTVTTYELYGGCREIVNANLGNKLQTNGSLDGLEFKTKSTITLNENECVLLNNHKGEGVSIGRRIGSKVQLVRSFNPWGLEPRNKEQMFLIDLLMDTNVPLVSVIGRAGSGKTLISLACCLELVLNKKLYKNLIICRPIQTIGGELGFLPGPQPLDAKILTPNGWTTMGELQVGSEVIAKDGSISKVLKIFPKGEKDVFKITTSDNVSTEACEDHLWYTTNMHERQINRNGSIKTTAKIQQTLKSKHYLPRNEAAQFTKTQLPISPYTFGVYLGDGGSSDGHLTITGKEKELLDRVSLEVAKYGCFLHQQKGNKLSHRIYYEGEQIGKKGAYNVKITNLITGECSIYKSIGEVSKLFNIHPTTLSKRCKKHTVINDNKYEYLDSKLFSSHPMVQLIGELGLHGKHAWEKFIPKQYLYAALEDRIELLKGLMDTDGTIKTSGEMSYTTTSKQLAIDVIELVRSLGGRASLCMRDRRGNANIIKGVQVVARRVSYEFTISLPSNINPFFISRKANRHNPNRQTVPSRITNVEYVSKKEVQCILIDHPEHLYVTDNFIVTHNTVEEKISPYYSAISDAFARLFASKNKANKTDTWKDQLFRYIDAGVIQQEPLTYMRGRSIPNALILLDEAQNLSKEEIKTILTRAGEGSKIILTGDVEQIDSGYLDAMNNGLTYVIDKFQSSHIAGHITLIKGERSELATISAEIL